MSKKSRSIILAIAAFFPLLAYAFPKFGLDVYSNKCSFEFKLHYFNFPDSIIPVKALPQIMLNTRVEFNGYSSDHRQKNLKVTYFRVGLDPEQKLKYRGKNLSPYLMKDPKSYSEFQKYRSLSVGKSTSDVICGVSFLGLFYYLLSDQEDNPNIYPMVGGIVIGFVGESIFNKSSYKHLKNAVSIYNNDAGYGYVNGLESTR